MGEFVSITYVREEEKKHSVRFKEGSAVLVGLHKDETPITEKVLGTIYVGRKGTTLANAKRLRVTVEVVE